MKQLYPVRSKAELLFRITFGFCVVLFIQSCDLFRTRMPEEPEVVSSRFVPATEPSLVFENMKNAFTDKNVVNYIKSFSDSTYIFVPSTGAQSLYGVLFLHWTVDEEEQYFSNLCTKAPPTLEWLSLKEESRNVSSVQYEVTYRISGLPSRATAEGKSQMLLQLTSSQIWVIVRWSDYESTTSGTISWSTVKATYIQ